MPLSELDTWLAYVSSCFPYSTEHSWFIHPMIIHASSGLIPSLLLLEFTSSWTIVWPVFRRENSGLQLGSALTMSWSIGWVVALIKHRPVCQQVTPALMLGAETCILFRWICDSRGLFYAMIAAPSVCREISAYIRLHVILSGPLYSCKIGAHVPHTWLGTIDSALKYMYGCVWMYTESSISAFTAANKHTLGFNRWCTHTWILTLRTSVSKLYVFSTLDPGQVRAEFGVKCEYPVSTPSTTLWFGYMIGNLWCLQNPQHSHCCIQPVFGCLGNADSDSVSSLPPEELSAHWSGISSQQDNNYLHTMLSITSSTILADPSFGVWFYRQQWLLWAKMVEVCARWRFGLSSLLSACHAAQATCTTAILLEVKTAAAAEGAAAIALYAAICCVLSVSAHNTIADNQLCERTACMLFEWRRWILGDKIVCAVSKCNFKLSIVGFTPS